jgi:hypothetical protein
MKFVKVSTSAFIPHFTLFRETVTSYLTIHKDPVKRQCISSQNNFRPGAVMWIDHCSYSVSKNHALCFPLDLTKKDKILMPSSTMAEENIAVWVILLCS